MKIYKLRGRGRAVIIGNCHRGEPMYERQHVKPVLGGIYRLSISAIQAYWSTSNFNWHVWWRQDQINKKEHRGPANGGQGKGTEGVVHQQGEKHEGICGALCGREKRNPSRPVE